MRRARELVWRRFHCRSDGGGRQRSGGKLPAQRMIWPMLWLLACANSDPSSARSAHTNYCRALCARTTACTPDYGVTTCMSLCENDPNGGRLTEQVWSGQAECISQQSCDALSTRQAHEICFDRAIALLEPSDACIEFCQLDAAASFECGAGYSIEECVGGSVCTWHDDVFRAASACQHTDDCEAREACLAGAFGP